MRQLEAMEISAISGGEGNNGSAHNGIIGGLLVGAGTGLVTGGAVGFAVFGPVGAVVGGALGTGIGALGGALSGFGDSDPPSTSNEKK